MKEESRIICDIILSIPRGKVLTYGKAAEMAGLRRGARTVARILRSCSEKYGLPWHRVISSAGRISIPGRGGEIQRELLMDEGIEVSPAGKISLDKYLWCNESEDLII